MTTFGTKFQKPTFNVLPFCRLAQFSPRRKLAELPFVDEKFKLVSRRRSYPLAHVSTAPFSLSLSCHRRGLHRIFMSSRAPFLPHIYATTARPDTDLAREAFSNARFSRGKPGCRHVLIRRRLSCLNPL